VIFNLLVLLIFAALWLGFIAALIGRPRALDDLWAKFRRLPLLLQLLLGLLFLPVVLALWIWQSRWAVWLRLLLVIALAWFNLYMFFPRA
jgi:hypothetical protein